VRNEGCHRTEGAGGKLSPSVSRPTSRCHRRFLARCRFPAPRHVVAIGSSLAVGSPPTSRRRRRFLAPCPVSSTAFCRPSHVVMHRRYPQCCSLSPWKVKKKWRKRSKKKREYAEKRGKRKRRENREKGKLAGKNFFSTHLFASCATRPGRRRSRDCALGFGLRWV
jgi:hypothetical protein